MAKRKTIPQHEPEIINSKARRRGGDMDKVATTSFGEMEVDGVKITSRYSKADELEEMQAMVSELPVPLRKNLCSIFCDSKASHNYIATMRQWDADAARQVAKVLDTVAFSRSKGHNGICVCAHDGTTLGDFTRSIDIGAAWSIDDFEP